MALCPQCGAEINPEHTFCGYCGAALTPPQASFSPEASGVYPQIPQYGQNTAAPIQHPMKWYKFVVYFQLFAGCASAFLTALSAFSGAMYGEDVGAVYSAYPDLPLVNTIYAVLLLFLCVSAIVARNKLYKFSRSGPKFYYIYLIAQLVISVLYTITAGSVAYANAEYAGYLPDLSALVSTVLTTGVIIACNIKYFDKRKDLFVNP